MKKLIMLLAFSLWGVLTSSKQCKQCSKQIEQYGQPTLVKSLDSLNNSLDRLKIAIDERN